MHSVAPEIRTAVLYNTKFHKGQDAVEIVTDLGASVFNIKRQRLTKKMLHRCREHEIPVGIYTVNDPRRMRRLVKKGIDAIFTDHPDRLLEVLNPTAMSAPAPPRSQRTHALIRISQFIFSLALWASVLQIPTRHRPLHRFLNSAFGLPRNDSV